jgi:tetratricopeptide (TPR) repeat protein
VGYWQDSETLYRHTLAVTDGNFVMLNELGSELVLQGRFDEAEQHFMQAAQLRPDWPAPRIGLAALALARGQIPKALRLFEEEVRRDPGNGRTAGMYGIALLRAGRYAEARVQLAPSLEMDGGSAGVHQAMAQIEAALGHPQASIRHSREALRLSPGDVSVLNNLAWTLATYEDPAIRDPAEAIRLIEPVARASNVPWLLDTLAAAYAAAQRFDLAVATASRAAELADQQGQAASAREIRARLSLYREAKPFVDIRSGR